MKMKLAYYGNPILRKKAEEVTEINDDIRELAKGMTELIQEVEGLGLSAPQVHRSVRMMLIWPPIRSDAEEHWDRDEIQVLINPKITAYSEETWVHSEGCLSIPGYYGDVERPVKIKVSAMDLEGNTFEKEYSGWVAKIILHENDHLNGVLFIDRIDRNERKRIDPLLRKLKKKYN